MLIFLFASCQPRDIMRFWSPKGHSSFYLVNISNNSPKKRKKKKKHWCNLFDFIENLLVVDLMTRGTSWGGGCSWFIEQFHSFFCLSRKNEIIFFVYKKSQSGLLFFQAGTFTFFDWFVSLFPPFFPLFPHCSVNHAIYLIFASCQPRDIMRFRSPKGHSSFYLVNISNNSP